METRLKQRLTGAAILVALVVLLVPEMFRGQHAEVATRASSSGEGPPMRSYFIDLSNGATRTAPLQSTPASSSGSDDKPMPAAPMTPTTPAASTASDHPVPNSAAPPAATASAPPMTASAAAPAVVATAPTHHAPASAPPVARPAAQPSHAGASGGWGVQLGLFAKRDNAERLVRAAQDKGFSVSVANPDARGLYRVYASGMADRVAAEAYSQRLKDQGLPAAVVSLP